MPSCYSTSRFALPLLLATIIETFHFGRHVAASRGAPAAAAAATNITSLLSGGVAVRLEPSGAFSVLLDNRPWLSGGASTIPLRSIEDGQPPTLLRQVAPPSDVMHGTDGWGSYEMVEMRWASNAARAATSAELVTSIRAYSNAEHEMVVFSQRWPQGWQAPTAGSPSSTIAPFPSLSTSAPNDGATLNFLQFGGCQLANTFSGRWTNSSPPGGGFDGKFGCQLGIPTLLYDKQGRSVVLSPSGNWLSAIHEQGEHSIGIGVTAAVRSLPAEFVYETMLVAGATINTTMRHLGDALLQKSGKPRPDPYDDFVLGHLGYWTDNGAFYDSSNNHTGYANHEVAILAVKKKWIEQKIPFRYVQMDDWQWVNSTTGLSGGNVDMPGIQHWPPDKVAIPSGMSDWLEMPTSQYCPMYSAFNDYITDSRYNYTWAVDDAATVGPTAIPVDVEFYRDVFKNGSRAQMKMFEQDFLCTYAASTNLTKGDVNTGMDWLHAMDTAAMEANITLQLCMMCPAHVLASTELRAVTNGRGTSDNDHSSQADLYPLGHSGLLMAAVGMTSSRDNVFTSAREPNCAKGNCTSPDYRLENVAAVLAGGPFGPSDGIDFLNAPEIAKSCRVDGVLLRADEPLATLDAALTLNFESPEGRGLFLWSTYSQIGALRWSYLLSVSTPSDNTLSLAEINSTPGLAYILYDVWAAGPSLAPSLKLISAGGSFVVPQSPPAPISGHSDGGSYQVLAPVLENGWCLLGEAYKTVAASRKRFVSIEQTTSGLRARLRAASGEEVKLWALPPHATEPTALVRDPVVGICHGPTCTALDCDTEMVVECVGTVCKCSVKP